MSWDAENWEWRFNELYKVKDEATGKPVDFHPRPEQLKILRAVYDEGLRNILVPKARQLGISTVIALIILDYLLFQSGIQAAIVDLTQGDATKKLQGKIVFAFERLPASLKQEYSLIDNNQSAFSIRLKSAPNDAISSVQAGLNARGDTFQVLHISEWGKIAYKDVQRSNEILTGALPAAKHGLRFIETTWKGGKGGDLWQIMDTAMKTLPEHMTTEDWNLFFFPWWGDPSYSLEGDVSQIPKEVSKYLDETERAIQHIQGKSFLFSPTQRLWYFKVAWAKGLFRFEEYPALLEECFKAPIEGAIYGALIDRLRMAGRIRPSEIDTTALVHTSWDLGSPINTVVWYWQIIGPEIRVIDCDMDIDMTPTARVAHILGKGYLLGWHYLPHDAMATQKSGRTFYHELTFLGLANIRTVPQTHDIWIGINHLRALLPRFTFRLPACERPLEAISCYHTKRETSSGVAIDLPVHDWSSHPADGLRTLAEAELAGMVHATGPSTVKPRVLSGPGGTQPKKPVGDQAQAFIDSFFDDKQRRATVRR